MQLSFSFTIINDREVFPIFFAHKLENGEFKIKNKHSEESLKLFNYLSLSFFSFLYDDK